MNKYSLVNRLDLEDGNSGDVFWDTRDFMDLNDDYTIVI